MGDLEEVGTDSWCAWTGSKPKIDWSCLDPSVSGQAITPTMYRGVGHKDSKAYQMRIRGLQKKLDEKLSTPLNSFTSAIFKYLKRHGLDTISYLPDPGNKSIMQSIVTHHTRYKLSDVITDSRALFNKYDKYDRANDEVAKLFLYASVSQSLYDQVEASIHPTDTFPIVWCKIMLEIHRNSHNFFKLQEAKIKNCDPVTSPVCSPGQQMDKWVEYIRKHVTVLVKSGKYDHRLSETIVTQAMHAGGDYNEDWKSFLPPIKIDLRAKYSELGLYPTNKEMEDDFERAKLLPFTILNKIKSYYQMLLDGGD